MKNKTQKQKSIYSDEYGMLLRLLRETREKAGITQVQLAARLGQTQSFVTKVECGDRRLDVIQLRTILAEFGVPLSKFITRFERELAKPQ